LSLDDLARAEMNQTEPPYHDMLKNQVSYAGALIEEGLMDANYNYIDAKENLTAKGGQAMFIKGQQVIVTWSPGGFMERIDIGDYCYINSVDIMYIKEAWRYGAEKHIPLKGLIELGDESAKEYCVCESIGAMAPFLIHMTMDELAELLNKEGK
jgi:hypothetical protein